MEGWICPNCRTKNLSFRGRCAHCGHLKPVSEPVIEEEVAPPAENIVVVTEWPGEEKPKKVRKPRKKKKE